MRNTLVLWVAVGLSGCGSIRNMSPDQAAARISASDSYKEEACDILQTYVNRYEAYRWQAAQPLEPLPEDEIRHMAAVFALRTDVSCRVKAGKFFYDIDGRAFGDIARVLGPLQNMYADLGPGESVAGCKNCALPSVGVSNGYLVAYFRRDPFPALRQEHAVAFTALCTDPDHLVQNEEAIVQHDEHAGKAGEFNPLYELHGGCETVWRKALNDLAPRCSRFAHTHYLVCPTGVWDTHTDPARPFSAYPGTSRAYSFGTGFALGLRDGRFDVYWQVEVDQLAHEVFALPKGVKPEPGDYDGNGKIDLSLGEDLILSETSGTARRTTLTAFNAKVQEKEFAKRASANLATWRKLPLDEIEKLLMGPDFSNPFLLERAADLSETWFDSAQDDQRALLELVQIYWHAALWNGIPPKEDKHRQFWERLQAKTAPNAFAVRQRSLLDLRKNGDAKALHEGCATLRNDMRIVVNDLTAALAGTKVADREVGPAWEKYLKKPIPVTAAEEALAAAKNNAGVLEAYLVEVCF